MNKEKVEKRLIKRYGVNPNEIKDLSITKIKNLKNINKEKLKQEDKFKVVKKPIGALIKGASIGASVAGCVNTAFPNLVPVVGTYLTTTSNFSNLEKTLGITLLASKPIDIVSGYGVIGIGASVGALLYSGYSLIKLGTNNLKIINDRNKAKKLCK